MILILIVLLTIINGFFAASEMALVQLTPQEISKWSGRNKIVVEKLKENSTKYLSTIQVMITLAGFMSSAFAGANLKTDFSNLMASINITVSETASLVIVTIILSYFTLVFGELVPKRIALLNHEGIAKFTAPVVYYSMKVATPFVWLLSVSTKGVLRLLGFKKITEDDEVNEEDIQEMILYGHMIGLYGKQEMTMMKHVFQIDDLPAKMVMTPREDVVMIGDKYDQEKIKKIIVESKLSRFPVFHNKKDSIVGIVLTKDLMGKYLEGGAIDLDAVIRRPLIVFDDIKINQLLTKMKRSSMHLACLVSKDGVFTGVVSLEDILEEIVGNIYDEHDDVLDPIEKENEFVYFVDKDMSIATINELLQIELPTPSKRIVDLFYKNVKQGVCKINNIELVDANEQIKIILQDKHI